MKMEINKIHQGNCLELIKQLEDNSVDSIVTDPPYGLSFMGKKWDYKVPSIEIWKECLRVLKHGGHLLSFSSSRTYHRIACAIEDAGFEIRDQMQWIYGSGFPKSLNIGKQIDKMQGNEREIIGTKIHSQKGVKVAEERGEIGGGAFGVSKEGDITKGTSEWEGWGTALKPAHEPIVVARKPLSEKNVALNVLKWGTGGINIDACRVGNRKDTRHGGGKSSEHIQQLNPDVKGYELPQGRFPANIILDEEVSRFADWCRFFYCAKASKSERNYGCENLEGKPIDIQQPHNSKDLEERYAMKFKNNHPTVKPVSLMEYLVKLVSKPKAIILDPFIGSGTTAIACLKLNRFFIGIEKEPKYIKIANARIKPFLEQQKLI